MNSKLLRIFARNVDILSKVPRARSSPFREHLLQDLSDLLNMAANDLERDSMEVDKRLQRGFAVYKRNEVKGANGSPSPKGVQIATAKQSAPKAPHRAQTMTIQPSSSLKSFLTSRQLQRRWSISAQTIWRLQRSGRITPIHIHGNRTVKFDLDEITRIEREAK